MNFRIRLTSFFGLLVMVRWRARTVAQNLVLTTPARSDSAPAVGSEAGQPRPASRLAASGVTDDLTWERRRRDGGHHALFPPVDEAVCVAKEEGKEPDDRATTETANVLGRR